MPKVVQLPDGNEAEFPDNMDNAAISAVIRKQFPPTQPQSGPPPTPPEQSIGEVITQGAGDLAQGAKSRLDKAALGIKGLLPQAVQAWGDKLDKAVGSGGLTKETAVVAPDTKMGALGDIGTEIALETVAGGPILKGAKLLGKAAQATRLGKLGGTVVGAGTDIAGNAAISAALTPEDRAEAAKWGAGGAAVGRGVGRVAGGLFRKSVSPEAKALMDEGIKITPGQAVSGSDAGIVAKALRSTEDKVTSIPFIGDVVKNAQTKSIESFDINRINDAIKSTGAKVKHAGIKGLEEADEHVSSLYDKHLPNIFVDPGKGLAEVKAGFTTAAQDPLFDKQHGKTLKTFIQRRVMPLLAKGPVDGATAKQLDAELGELGREYLASGIGNRPLGRGFMELRNSWRAAMEGTTPDAIKGLQDANAAYAKLLPIQKAGEKTATGVFSPKQLADSLRTNKHAADDLTQKARVVLPNSVPDSGTAGRTMLAKLLSPAGMGAGAATGIGAAGYIPAAVATGLGSMLYTRPGLRAVTEGVHPLVDALRKKAGKQPLDPDDLEAAINNLIGRSVTASGSE